ncbi:MAG TPA: DUF2182 domain-containing protein, partial [Gammaproteobacteria bacterium]|nr:DUF2182 domain-containing protein [Gammaproteobacteria bacterium]
WTPLKQACLKRCRSPLGFILFCWRNGLRGALFMGLEHGVYCMGAASIPFKAEKSSLPRQTHCRSDAQRIR